MIRLRPLREDEWPAWRAASQSGYARDLNENGGLPEDVAARKAEADFTALWPDGPASTGNVLLAVEEDGEARGAVWFAERDFHGLRQAYLYEIVIDEAQRGRGLGRAAMLCLEDEVRARGLGRIELNVFGGNERARGLYRSLGYVETAVHMARELP